VLVFIALTLAGFSLTDAGTWAVGGVAALWAFLLAAPLGVLCVAVSVLLLLFGVVALMDAADRNLHR
jgi:hypothetical protein